MTTALVIAGTSFVGRHLTTALLERGVRVLVTSRRGDPQAELLPCEITDGAAVRRLLAETRPNWVFQCAAATTTAASVELLYRTHVQGTLNVLAAAAECTPHAQIILFGSAAEYGPVPAEQLPVRETQPAAPTSPFGASKLAQTHLAQAAAARWGLRVAIVRPFNIIGPGIPSHYLPGMLLRRLRETPADQDFLIANAEATRDLVDVRDVATAAIALVSVDTALSPGAAPIFNIATGCETSVGAVTTHLCSLAGGRRVVADANAASRSDILRSCGDGTRLRHTVGWQPRVTWQQSLEDLWRSVRNS